MERHVPRPTARLRAATAVVALALATSGAAFAAENPGTLEMPAAAAPTGADAPTAAVERPTRGMRMAQVESRFGAPTSRQDAVGRPPITRWEYPGFIVFFEGEFVIHAVPR